MLGSDRSNDKSVAAWRVFFMQEELSSYRQQMGRVQQLATQPYREVRERWKQRDEELCSERSMGIVVRLLMPALMRVAEHAIRTEARARLTDLGIALTRYKLVHGSYPASLDDLDAQAQPLLTVDPFDGKPLRMITVAGGGLVLYSVGPDGIDDQGREFDGKTKLGDITFCLGRAHHTRRNIKK
jgi:hypothetical protein